MKKFRMFAVAVLAAISISANAQEAFSTVYVQYSPTLLKVSYDGVSASKTYNNISLGYSYATPIAAETLYLEAGLKAQYMFNKDSDELHDIKTHMFSATLPVNLFYDIELADGKFFLDPYVGVFLRGNILGKSKAEGKSGNTHERDLFKDEDMNGDAFKRISFGIQAGVKARISGKFVVGAGYFMDITKICEHTHLEGFEFTLGYAF
ncbi:MAG: porin family protein [Prevotella sp.]|nr:porin family protein [Prevotella sp.]